MEASISGRHVRIQDESTLTPVNDQRVKTQDEPTLMIDMRGIHKTYLMGDEPVRALDGIDFAVAKGEFVSVIGASGSGKSTLMNIIGLLDVPDEGTYYLAGRDAASLFDSDAARIRNRTIGFVFQDFNLLPTMNAFENVRLPLLYRGIKPKEAGERAREALTRVGLGNRSGHLPAQLSGGQQQRVAIARALAGKPEVLLADEPTGALDSKTSEEIMQLLEASNSAGQTIVFITHNPELALRASRSVSISDGHIQERTAS